MRVCLRLPLYKLFAVYGRAISCHLARRIRQAIQSAADGAAAPGCSVKASQLSGLSLLADCQHYSRRHSLDSCEFGRLALAVAVID